MAGYGNVLFSFRRHVLLLASSALHWHSASRVSVTIPNFSGLPSTTEAEILSARSHYLSVDTRAPVAATKMPPPRAANFADSRRALVLLFASKPIYRFNVNRPLANRRLSTIYPHLPHGLRKARSVAVASSRRASPSPGAPRHDAWARHCASAAKREGDVRRLAPHA